MGDGFCAENWIDLDYQHRIKITVDTTKTIKDGLKSAVNYLPACISPKNKHNIIITQGETKIVPYIWDNGKNKTWEKCNDSSIILDDLSCDYCISIPVFKDIGKLEYYIYYNISKEDGSLGGKKRAERLEQAKERGTHTKEEWEEKIIYPQK